ncbi:hypothetical protein GBW32_07515 [Streptomyces tsukubensis]|nr:hypothetical protein GBW32_07515 [Streptomyces tsukubensis]
MKGGGACGCTAGATTRRSLSWFCCPFPALRRCRSSHPAAVSALRPFGGFGLSEEPRTRISGRASREPGTDRGLRVPAGRGERSGRGGAGGRGGASGRGGAGQVAGPGARPARGCPATAVRIRAASPSPPPVPPW